MKKLLVLRPALILFALPSVFLACSAQTSKPSPTVSGPTSVATTMNAAADLNGTWAGYMTDRDGNQHPIELNLRVKGDAVTGTLTGGPPTGEAQPIFDGRVAGDSFTFDLKITGPNGDSFVAVYQGKIAGNQIKGTSGKQGSPDMSKNPWSITKK